MADLVKTIKIGVEELEAKISPEAIAGLDTLFAPKADFDTLAENYANLSAGLDGRFVAKATYDTLKADYDALKLEHEKIMPKYAHFSVAEADKIKITKIHIHKFACPDRFDDEPEGYKPDKLSTAVIIGRDGDFGYQAIDGTGQVNFTVEFADAYKEGYTVIPEITNTDGTADAKGNADGYKSFKSKYSTGLNCPLGTAFDYQGLVTEGIFRITKLTKDINVVLHVVKESELPAHTITYNLITPEGITPVVRAYRCVDGIEKTSKYNNYPESFYNTLKFVDGVATDATYESDSGFRSNSTYAEGAARLQFTVTGLPEDYVHSATISGKAKQDYSTFEFSPDFGGYYVAKKVGTDLAVTIKVSPPVPVEYIKGSFEFDSANLAKAAAESDFKFTIYYDKEKLNYNEQQRLRPTPSEVIENCIESITVDGTELVAGTDYYVSTEINPDSYQGYKDSLKNPYYILSDGTTVKADEATEEQLALRVNSYIAISGKKATVTIKGSKVVGNNIVITTKTVTV